MKAREAVLKGVNSMGKNYMSSTCVNPEAEAAHKEIPKEKKPGPLMPLL